MRTFIYTLWLDGKCVYVGQSNNPRERVLKGHTKPSGTFFGESPKATGERVIGAKFLAAKLGICSGVIEKRLKDGKQEIFFQPIPFELMR